MLWELEQIDVRLGEIEAELKALARTTGVSSKKRRIKNAELNRESTDLQIKRSKIQSLVDRDPQLSKMRDQFLEEKRLKALEPKPLREAEMGAVETKDRLPEPPKNAKEAMQLYIKRQELTAAQREIAQSKELENEWEPD